MKHAYHPILAAGAVLYVLAGSPSYAQLAIGDIDPADPFGAIDVDVAGGDVAGMTAGLEAAQNAELKERCELLIANPVAFAENDLQLCIVLLGRDNEGLTAAGLKEAAAAKDVQVAPGGAAAGAAAATPAADPNAPADGQTQPVSPELGAEGGPEGNQ